MMLIGNTCLLLSGNMAFLDRRGFSVETLQDGCLSLCRKHAELSIVLYITEDQSTSVSRYIVVLDTV